MFLYVSVRLHGEVVDQRLIGVEDDVRVGDHPSAEVSFPGADLLVRCFDGRLRVRGHWLEDGDDLSMKLGDVEVVLEAVSADRASLPRRSSWDVRLLVATAAIALFGGFIDAVEAFVDDNPVVAHRVEQLLPWSPDVDAAPRSAELGQVPNEDLDLDSDVIVIEVERPRSVEMSPATYTPTAPVIVTGE